MGMAEPMRSHSHRQIRNLAFHPAQVGIHALRAQRSKQRFAEHVAEDVGLIPVLDARIGSPIAEPPHIIAVQSIQAATDEHSPAPLLSWSRCG